jgi:hypothetical protein
VEEIHQIYKDPRGLLVMIISETALITTKKQPLYEPILLLLAVLFGLAFLYLSFTE